MLIENVIQLSFESLIFSFAYAAIWTTKICHQMLFAAENMGRSCPLHSWYEFRFLIVHLFFLHFNQATVKKL